MKVAVGLVVAFGCGLGAGYALRGKSGPVQQDCLDENAALRAERLAIDGNPIPWSFNTDPLYAPERVREELEKVRETCPEGVGRFQHVDCDEYPCLLWAGRLGTRPGFPDVVDCPDWPYEFGGLNYTTRRLPTGQDFTYSVLPVTPRGQETPYGDDDYQKRLDARRKRIQDDVLEGWAASL